MAVFLVIAILLLTLAVTPLCVTVKTGVDILRNRGYLRLWFFFIPVLRLEFHVESPDFRHRNLIVERKKKKREIHLNADKNDSQSIRNLIKRMPLMRVVRIRNLTIDAAIGKSDDAMFTTFTLGALRTVYYALAAFLKSRENVAVEGAFTPAYNRDVLKADVFGIISLSLANIIISLIQALFSYIKRPRARKRAAIKGRQSI